MCTCLLFYLSTFLSAYPCQPALQNPLIRLIPHTFRCVTRHRVANFAFAVWIRPHDRNIFPFVFRREMDFDIWLQVVDVEFIFDNEIIDAAKDIISYFPHFKAFHWTMPDKSSAKNFKIRQRFLERCGRGMDGKNPASFNYIRTYAKDI